MNNPKDLIERAISVSEVGYYEAKEILREPFVNKGKEKYILVGTMPRQVLRSPSRAREMCWGEDIVSDTAVLYKFILVRLTPKEIRRDKKLIKEQFSKESVWGDCRNLACGVDTSRISSQMDGIY